MTLSKRPILLHVEQSGDAASIRTGIANAVTNGFNGVEIALPNLAVSFASPDAKAEAGVIAVTAICRSTDVTAGLAEVSSMLCLAVTCRATCLNLTLPAVDGCQGGAGFSRYQDGLNFAYRVLYDLRFEAESAGVAIAIEAATAGGLLSPVELREIINQANSPAVGACLDVARVARVGVVEDWIATLGYRIKSLRVEPTEENDLDSLAGALGAVDYDGPVIVKGPRDPGRLRSAVARLAGTVVNG